MKRAHTKNRRRAGFFLFLMVSQILLVVAIWQYHQVLVTVYDETTSGMYARWFGKARGEGEGRTTQMRVGLFRSEWERKDPATDAHQEELIRVWGRYLDAEDMGYRIIPSLIAPNAVASVDVLILPYAVSMSDAEIAVVKDHLSRNRGVILSWAAGSRDEEGRWRTDSLFRHVAGITLDAEQPAQTGKEGWGLFLSARSPITADLPPGFVLKIRDYDRPLFAHVREARTHSAGFWVAPPARPESLAAAKSPEPEKAGEQPSGSEEAEDSTGAELAPLTSAQHTDLSGLVSGEYMGGRFVWFGYTIMGATDEPFQMAAFQTVVRNAVRWAGRQIQAFKPLWPQEKSSAFSLSVLVRTRDDLDHRLFEMARVNSIPLTLYVSGERLRDESIPWATLTHTAEIALLDDASEAEQNLNTQVARLQEEADLLRRWNGDERLGYRRVNGTSDERLLDALVRSGFRHLSASDAVQIVPKVVRSYRRARFLTRPRELWLLPERAPESGPEMESAIAQYRVSHEMGGYLQVILDPATTSEAMLGELDRLLHQVKEDDVWIASVREVANHSRLWGHLKIATRYLSGGRSRIHISNSGLETIKDINLFVEVDRPVRNLVMKPTTLGSPHLLASSRDGLRWKLYLEAIPPGKNFAYYAHPDTQK